MDNKNFLLFIAIAMFVILGWNFMAKEMGWISTEQKQNAPVAGTPHAPAPSQPEGAQAANAPTTVQTPGKSITVSTPLYTAVLDSNGGLLRSFELSTYKASMEEKAPNVSIVNKNSATAAVMGLTLNGIATWSSASWQVETGPNAEINKESDLYLTLKNEQETLRLTADIEGMKVSRVFTFKPNTYVIEERVEINSPLQRAVTLNFRLATETLTSPEESNNRTRLAYLKNNSFSEKQSESDLKEGIKEAGNLGWTAILSNYFIAAICPAEGDSNFKGLLKDKVYSIALEKNGLELTPGTDVSYSVSYYLGPKKMNDLELGPKGLDKALDYGWFTIIAKPLIWLLKTLYGFVGNYGVAIILLTVIIKLALWPLSNKGYKSMEKMKKIQPLMAKMREKYKDDKQELNKQTMQLYKTYGVSPMGGCLPMLLQLPIFIGLYSGLLNAIELRQAPFIPQLPFTDMAWLADLSLKDPYFITPIVMGLTMLIQQKITPATGDPMQAKIMMLMPVIFTVMFATFPSGLVVYWLTNNIISIAQQWWMLRTKS